MYLRRSGLFLGCILAGFEASPTSAQSVPTIDTEDATLGSADTAGNGRFHPMIGFDLRNGDFARGSYDDDPADLDRLPVHAQVGVAVELTRGVDGKATSWFLLRSSNGFHAAGVGEKSPRNWYESNNLVALVVTPVTGVKAAAVYTIKTSPNDISATTHEASLSFTYDANDSLGDLSPTFAATVRPKGDTGLFTQFGIEPNILPSSRSGAPSVSLPLAIGVGWDGFYGARTGTRKFASVGAAFEQPFLLGDTHWSARAEALALIRDDRLALLSGPRGETGTVVPLVTLSISAAY